MDAGKLRPDIVYEFIQGNKNKIDKAKKFYTLCN